MKITVVGAGAVGGYFGGRFAEAGFDVTFLVREKRAEQLKRTGLVIESPFGNSKLQPKLAISPSEIEECDLILLAVKNYHLENVYESIGPLIEKGAKLLPLLNGVEHFDRLAERFGKEAILGGLCHIIATLNAEGHILHTNNLHHVTFGALVPEQLEFCQRLAEAAQPANLKLILSDQVLIDIWNKYVFITAFSGITTASRLPIDQVIQYEATLQTYRHTLEEMCKLAEAKGAKQEDHLVDQIIERVKKLPPGSTSSMHQDFRKGLSLEVESLQGAAVRMAAQMGLELPTVRTLYGLIKPYEHGALN